jgi:uncharacterized protein (TIGR02594 family)
MSSSTEPAWLRTARAELGVAERPGTAADPNIMRYYREVGHDWVVDDAVAWCAAFVGATLERNGIASTRSLRARSYLDWGHPLTQPRVGAIAVFSRGADPAAGHVGFVTGATPTTLHILGGNQSDTVSITALPRTRLLALRWPAIDPSGPIADGFAVALHHVRLQEGNWSDHPDDPGGPTHQGITLAVFAAHHDRIVTPKNRGQLIAELKAITATEVATIYHQRYWRRAACDQLPAGLALMHFDAAVNQGPVTAIRLLQEAAGSAIDGEFGPVTARAVRALSLRALIEAYAKARQRRYRQTKNFAVFGRGWLARVEATRSAALALLANPQSKETDMTQQPKWWARSLTIWGAIITAVSTVLPLIGPLLGLDITGVAVQQFGEQVSQLIQALGGIAGTIMTVYGRVRADAPLETRQIQVSL